MVSFSPTFKWIVPGINVVTRDRSFPHGQTSLSHIGKGGRNSSILERMHYLLSIFSLFVRETVLD